MILLIHSREQNEAPIETRSQYYFRRVIGWSSGVSGVTENTTAPLQSQVLCPKPYITYLASLRLCPLLPRVPRSVGVACFRFLIRHYLQKHLYRIGVNCWLRIRLVGFCATRVV
ncbi:hypothetical protein TNCV_4807881 [Trichonephila clavipes]|nr:hypothetical protein TNCV_4807881 [Trichonephila clavipes]